MPDNGQLYEAILGWARDGKTDTDDYGSDVNGEGPEGKVSGCYLMGGGSKAQNQYAVEQRCHHLCTLADPPALSGFGPSPSPTIPC